MTFICYPDGSVLLAQLSLNSLIGGSKNYFVGTKIALWDEGSRLNDLPIALLLIKPILVMDRIVTLDFAKLKPSAGLAKIALTQFREVLNCH